MHFSTAARSVERGLQSGATESHITVRKLVKTYGGVCVYRDFELEIPKHRVTCIFGPNGCGKSTLMNMIAGLVPTDSGSILFGGKTLAESTIGYVFQNYRDALMPWMRAEDNIQYPLLLAGKSKAQRAERVDELVASFDIQFDLKRYPYELSGGQQQLVSIMRALAPKPEVLFLDEPFSALDYEMTLAMRDKLQEVFRATQTTLVIVSHDLEEAVYLADHVLLLTKRPTRIAAWVDVDILRPRDMSTLSDDEFIRTRARCLEIFQKEVRR